MHDKGSLYNIYCGCLYSVPPPSVTAILTIFPFIEPSLSVRVGSDVIPILRVRKQVSELRLLGTAVHTCKYTIHGLKKGSSLFLRLINRLLMTSILELRWSSKTTNLFRKAQNHRQQDHFFKSLPVPWRYWRRRCLLMRAEVRKGRLQPGGESRAKLDTRKECVESRTRALKRARWGDVS